MQATIPFALGRIAFGAGLIAAPDRVASGWLPGDAAPGTQVAVRGLGARDVALAAGVIASGASAVADRVPGLRPRRHRRDARRR